MATPDRKRPATMGLRLVAVADSSGPTSIGSAHSMNDARRPSASAKPPPTRLPAAAPISVLLTTWGSEQGWGTWGLVGGPRSRALFCRRPDYGNIPEGLRRARGAQPQPPAPTHQALQRLVGREPEVLGDLLQRAVDDAQVVAKGKRAAARDADGGEHRAHVGAVGGRRRRRRAAGRGARRRRGLGAGRGGARARRGGGAGCGGGFGVGWGWRGVGWGCKGQAAGGRPSAGALCSSPPPRQVHWRGRRPRAPPAAPAAPAARPCAPAWRRRRRPRGAATPDAARPGRRPRAAAPRPARPAAPARTRQAARRGVARAGRRHARGRRAGARRAERRGADAARQRLARAPACEGGPEARRHCPIRARRRRGAGWGRGAGGRDPRAHAGWGRAYRGG
jgi:hypothetical protein